MRWPGCRGCPARPSLSSSQQRGSPVHAAPRATAPGAAPGPGHPLSIRAAYVADGDGVGDGEVGDGVGLALGVGDGLLLGLGEGVGEVGPGVGLAGRDGLGLGVRRGLGSADGV
jgi:hypothetical protein